MTALEEMGQWLVAVSRLATENERLRKALEAADGALEKCDELFSDIRGDWTDPRHGCRMGWQTVEQARAVIAAALKEAGDE